MCGVFGVRAPGRDVARLSYFGLYALQHRGQESAGIVSSRGDALISHRGLGLVADIFHPDIIRRLVGTAAIGHNRYATHGETVLKNAQPLVVEYQGGALAVAHNGNLVNADELRQRLEATGSIFQSTSDTEVVLHLYARSRKAMSSSRPKTSLPVTGNLATEIFSGPSFACGLRVMAREVLEGFLCRL
jgi:amidophosphoribosyltransferase